VRRDERLFLGVIAGVVDGVVYAFAWAYSSVWTFAAASAWAVLVGGIMLWLAKGES
jgi:hypothetical protein